MPYRVVYTDTFHTELEAYLAFFVVDEGRREVQLLSFRHGARNRDAD